MLVGVRFCVVFGGVLEGVLVEEPFSETLLYFFVRENCNKYWLDKMRGKCWRAIESLPVFERFFNIPLPFWPTAWDSAFLFIFQIQEYITNCRLFAQDSIQSCGRSSYFLQSLLDQRILPLFHTARQRA